MCVYKGLCLRVHGKRTSIAASHGLVFAFVDFPRTTDPRVRGNDVDTDIMQFQATDKSFLPEERAAAHLVHVEALTLAMGGILYKVSRTIGLVVAQIEHPYRESLAIEFVELGVTHAQLKAVHEFMLELRRRGTKHNYAGMFSLAITGSTGTDEDISAVTCSQALVLALRHAGVDIDEPLDAHTGRPLPSGLFTPPRLYCCLQRLVAAGRARVLEGDPTRALFHGAAAAAQTAREPDPRAPVQRAEASAARPPLYGGAASAPGTGPSMLELALQNSVGAPRRKEPARKSLQLRRACDL